MDESFLFALDWDLLLRFREAGARMVRLPRFLGAFRVHERAKTQTILASQGSREMARLRKRCHGRAVTRSEIRRHLVSHWLRRVIIHHLYTFGLLRY